MNVFSIHENFSDSSIKLPFPPIIDDIDDLFKIKKNSQIPKKPPNAFLIYRNIYVKEYQSKIGEVSQMTFLSSEIANSWYCEENHVREEYKKLADIVAKRFNELYPKNNQVIVKNNNKNKKNRNKKYINYDDDFFNQKSNEIDIFNEYNQYKNIYNLEINNNYDLHFQDYSSQHLQQNMINTDYQKMYNIQYCELYSDPIFQNMF
ncbi:8367_t:CDS:1 [Scutellospora calospora]|uniref:8367_t:CDS:1 n=1 Tax=Scutellospora calospora TaxID=85575 RepID=A0ACA9JZ78_9GLOM|nr:8367_t:CDS:1 [Scutellospora calospora]